MVALKARITSLTFVVATRCTKESIKRSEGPTPSMGDIKPPRTW
jgi:hypothetical protein